MLFLLTPLREGRRPFSAFCRIPRRFLLTPLREGRHLLTNITTTKRVSFLLTPLREGRQEGICDDSDDRSISTHAPAGGATRSTDAPSSGLRIFLLTPLREGRLLSRLTTPLRYGFLLTPLREGRLMAAADIDGTDTFLLTPLREGRQIRLGFWLRSTKHFYSRPCGRGDPE